MRRLGVFNLVSLDGYFAGPGGDISWHNPDQEFQELRIKVDDGVIVFPIEAKGKRAIAEGQFSKIEMTMEETLAYRKHHAEEHNEEFDPGKVTEPMTYYQIKATGAVIR